MKIGLCKRPIFMERVRSTSGQNHQLVKKVLMQKQRTRGV